VSDPARSALTNGSRLLPAEVDGRGAWPRRFRDLIEIHVSDLGGDDLLSEAERQLVRRIVTLEVECERLEAAFATAGSADAELLDIYLRAAGLSKRLAETIGLRRRSRPIPSLDEVMAGG